MQLGAVLGYLAAGAIIGPWGLGLIADADATLDFAEMGVVLLLFLIGLELEPSRGRGFNSCRSGHTMKGLLR